ncbi:MAG TPA: HRDC domain-containing protein [bacterium]|nr:HRDC domain-containing protein [bacterium]
MTDCTLIETQDALDAACAHFAAAPALAVDFEGEWNCHHYGNYLCLVQIADGAQVWLIDALAKLDLAPLWAVLLAPEVLKVMHDPQSDFLLLDKQFACHPRNIFDTAKAAHLLGRERLGLAGMLHDYCGVDKEEGCQADDWTVRPLAARMREYAAHDVRTLLALHERLKGELQEKGRLAWHAEECRRLESIRFTADPEPHLRVKGAKKLPRFAREVLRELHALREQTAQAADKPPYQIINNLLLLKLAQNPPEDAAGWHELRGVHPFVKRQARDWHEAAQRGRQAGQQLALCPPPPAEPYRPREPGDQVARREKLLTKVQQEIARRHPDVSQIIMSQVMVRNLARGEANDSLRQWQRAVIVQVARELQLELDEDWFPAAADI